MLLLCALVWFEPAAYAHHVIGRPAYNWNEDSNTPPSMQVDTQMGDYFITYMVFPAFPKPNEPGRINLYAKRLDNDKPFNGKVSFTVRDDSWFNKREERIGVQTVDDNVFRQRFLFREPGSYIITAEFSDGSVPYIIDFPLQIGAPSRIGVIGVLMGGMVIVLIGVNVYRRRRLVEEKVRDAAHDRKQK
jgi:hypothetical protein